MPKFGRLNELASVDPPLLFFKLTKSALALCDKLTESKLPKLILSINVCFLSKKGFSNDSCIFGSRKASKSIDSDGALALNTSDATDSTSNYFNNTSPTSSVVTVNTNNSVNNSGGTIIAYCFTDIKGYSKFGSFIGNANADGPMLYTGFRPAWFLVKNTAASEHWRIYDNKRNTFNHMFRLLNPNESSTESIAAIPVSTLSEPYSHLVQDNL